MEHEEHRCRWCRRRIHYVGLDQSGNDAAVWYCTEENGGGYYCARDPRSPSAGKPYKAKLSRFAMAA